MEVTLKELSVPESKLIHTMVLEIGPGENGFVNGLYIEKEEQFLEKINEYYKMSLGIDLAPQYVPQTIYWLYVDNYPVGYGKLRHYLDDNLLNHGGHIGCVIRPSCRNQGYGKVLLKEIVKKAKEKNIESVLLTCDEINIASRRIIEANNGVLKDLDNGVCKYWIQI